MSEEELDGFLQELDELEDGDPDRQVLQRLGLSDSEPTDIESFDPE